MRDYLTEKRFEEVAVERIGSKELHRDVRAADERTHDPSELASDDGERRDPERDHRREAARGRHATPERAAEDEVSGDPGAGEDEDVDEP